MEIGQKEAVRYFLRSVFDKNGNIKDMSKEEFYKLIKPVLSVFGIKSDLKRGYVQATSSEDSVFKALYDILRVGDTPSLNKIKAITGGRKDLIRDILAENGWWDFDKRKITMELEDFD